MQQTLEQPVIRGVRFFLAHTPGLVRYGSKPSRDILRDQTVAEAIGRQLEAAKLVAQVELNVIPLADRAAVDGLAASKSYALPDTFPGVDVALVDGPS